MMDTQETEIIMEAITDWWMFGATIFAGVLTAIVTFIAVWYTNKKTVELYEKDKEYQNRRNNMVIIKPTIKMGSFFGIIEELILFNIRDRVLLVSSDKDGFDFFDDNEKRNIQNNRLFSIKNESKKDIHSVKLDIKTILKTSSDAKIEDHFSNFVNLLRGNEEIIVRMHNTEQRDKLWEELDKNNQTILNFDGTIDYLTSANEQVRYNFEAEIVNIPEKTTIENQDVVCNNAKISILKDEYKILEKRILKDNMKTSVYRNMQDYVNLDRVKYIHQKIGAAQAQGAMTQIGNVFSSPYQSHPNTIDVSDKNKEAIGGSNEAKV